ncbi:MAG: type II toxin-antitoxin system VapC family toxin [Candidatus Pacebacteria bacterium]|nr:type II toxin-antitoxin system VapC family toxin [Candidatus Paceibacterota bacterium]MDI9578465.1 type II toxin-antitoxin system VapC family toxin [Thermoproteota archaeon]
MKYLFDSSAIFRAIKENKIELLNGSYTLELARYELGNIIWKDHVLQSTLSKQEAQIIARTIKHTLAIMEVLQIAGKEEEILDTAEEHKITFYDASYAYFAKEKHLQLITEDLRLIKKISPTITALTLKDIEL